MAKLVITVPDQLAEQLRHRDVSVDAVCQRALLDAAGERSTARDPVELAGGPCLTYRARAVVDLAQTMAAEPTSADLLRALLAEGDFACEVLRLVHVDVESLDSALRNGARPTMQLDGMDAVLKRATAHATEHAHAHIGSEHLLLGLASGPDDEFVADALRAAGANMAELESAVVFMLAGFTFARRSGGLAGLGAPAGGHESRLT